jgi:hypothetical protein
MQDNIASDLFDYSGFYGTTHETLYNSISQKLTRSANMKYIKNLNPAKYYKLDEIFHCLNVRYINKCQIRGDTNIIFLDEEGKLVNIMDSAYDTSVTNKKLADILGIAIDILAGTTGGSLYYNKYLKYKMKYLKLKKLI